MSGFTSALNEQKIKDNVDFLLNEQIKKGKNKGGYTFWFYRLNKTSVEMEFLEKIKRKLYGDKGYISSKLTQLLFVDGIQLITGIRDKMKNCLLELKDKILLRKRVCY